MRKTAWFAFFPLLLVYLLAGTRRTWPCVAVLDSANLRVKVDHQLETVTLIGVDESNTGVCGERGRAYVSELALNRPLRVETDRVLRNEEGHLLAYIYLADGTFLNERVLALGLARLKPMGENTAHAGELMTAQLQAQSLGLCVWGPAASPSGAPPIHRHAPGWLGGGGGGARKRPSPLPLKNPFPPRHGSDFD